MTNVEALKEVFVALGGSAEDFTATTNDEAIALIASVAGGGSGGTISMMVTVTNNNEVYTLSKTWKEIFDCMTAGGIVFLKYDDEYKDAQDETVVYNFGQILTVTGVVYDEGMTNYKVYADSIREAHATEFTASTPDDYPSYDAN